LTGSAPRTERGERKLVTILFADLSGYTALSETLDPEEVYGFLRPTMAELKAIVESFGGTVPQIQGDGFMAIFGVPVAHEDDAERAVRSALGVRDRIRSLNAGRRGIRLPEVHAGVNSGEVMVGPSDEPSGFSVIGDTVNTASRLVGLATAGHILVDETTRDRTNRSIRYGPRRLRRAKGKAEPLATYEALEPARRPAPVAGRVFVDRTETLALLGHELQHAERTRSARVLVLSGEPGIGKSRLAEELGRSLAPQRFIVGRAEPFGERRPLSPLADAVADAVGVTRDATPTDAREAIDRAARRIARGKRAPGLAADLRALILADPASPRGEADVARAARLVLEDRARQGPVILVLDDLQWADRSLIEWLQETSRDPWPAAVLIVGLSRERLPGLPATPLPALDAGSMHVLAELLLGGDGATGVTGVPVSRANGNALFLEEMVGMLVESGAIRRDGDAWRVADPSAPDDVPASIRLLIAARLDTLPPHEKELLEDASVCGTVIWDALLADVSDVVDQRAALKDLVARGLLRRNRRSTIAGAREFEWKHSLIRDVAYGALPKSIRAERHAQIATWLRARSKPEPIASIAHHYERAWQLSQSRTGPSPDVTIARQAAAYLTRWAEETFARQARAAEALFRRALRVADAEGRAADPRVTARASVGLAEALIEMGSHAEAIEQARRARRMAEQLDDGDLTGRALLALGRAVSDGGQLRRGRALLEDARTRFEASGDLRGQGWALHRLSETWGWAGLERELEDLRSAYALFARARDPFGRAVVANDLAYILSVDGGPEFHRWYEQARRLVEGEGDLRSRASLLRTWGFYLYSAGRFSETLGVVADARPLASEAGDRYMEADTLLIGALAGTRAGDPGAATALARDAGAIGRELGSARIPALARLAIARAELRRGRPTAAVRALREARATVQERGIRVMHGDLAETDAMLSLDRGTWDEAGSRARALAAALRREPLGLWTPLPALIRGRGQLGSGDAARAFAEFDRAVEGAEGADAGGTLALAKVYRTQAALLAGRPAGRLPSYPPSTRESEIGAVAAETVGIARLLRGDPRAAAEALEGAALRWEAFGVTSWLARARSLHAAALSQAGDRAAAAASMDRARATMDRIRMPARSRTSIERPPAVGDRPLPD
jgi:class 3 adenylate cyclase/tetratricopeptide (TPR) repeat protein